MEDKSEAPYLTGHVRHTIYGSPEQLSEKQKRFRMMNHDEFKSYCDKAKQSGGFDVDDCTGCLPGGIVPIELTSNWWDISESAAHFAVLKHNMNAGTDLKYKELVKANMQGIAGLRYYFTLTALDPTDETEKLYRAKVTDTPWKSCQERLALESFELFTTGDKTAEQMRLEIENKFKELAKKGFRRPSLDISDFHEPTPREIAAKGYFMFLKDFRNENPRWKYATARRIASRKWKSLNSIEKCIYVAEAEKELTENQFGFRS